MHVTFHKYFEKRFDKLPNKIKLKTTERIGLFRTDPFAAILDNHPLGGKYKGKRSIDITGDYRAIYRPIDKDFALFVHIGTHGQLYK